MRQPADQRPSLCLLLSSDPPSLAPFLCLLDLSSVHLFVSRPLCAEQRGDFPSLRVSDDERRVAAAQRQSDEGTAGRRAETRPAKRRSGTIMGRRSSHQPISQPARTQSAFRARLLRAQRLALTTMCRS